MPRRRISSVKLVSRVFWIEPAVWFFGLALLPLPSVGGHALDPGRPRVEVGVDLLHLAAAAVWTGGLVQLAFALRTSSDGGALVRSHGTRQRRAASIGGDTASGPINAGC